ncbi:DUF3489 domain-containing protein [Novosphingobium sp. MW5]|nr:DUF3489 domain-containing protein [Novosphingobium sp. MW5]
MTNTIEPHIAKKRAPRMAREPIVDTIAAIEISATAKVAAEPKLKRQTKAAQVEALLAAGEGASLDALCKTSGWQAHTCRAFLTGLRKKGKQVERT